MRALTDLAVAWRGGRRATRDSLPLDLALARLHLLILHLGLGGEVYLGVGGEVKRRRL